MVSPGLLKLLSLQRYLKKLVLFVYQILFLRIIIDTYFHSLLYLLGLRMYSKMKIFRAYLVNFDSL